jgi:photosystem II stability/assembly factor-like uncharacterized protein
MKKVDTERRSRRKFFAIRFAWAFVLFTVVFAGCGPYNLFDALLVHPFGLFANDYLMIGADGSGPSGLFYGNPDDIWFRNVFAKGPGGVFAVGHKNAASYGMIYTSGIWYYDGSMWISFGGEKFRRYERIYDVWMNEPNCVFFVGGYAVKPGNVRGLVLHYDGVKWSETDLQNCGALNSVWGNAGDDIFAVGDEKTILHYNGSIWSKTTALSERVEYVDFQDVWAGGPNDVFVVGGHDILTRYAVILHYDGVKWSETILRDCGPLNSVWGTGPNEVFAVGDDATVLHYDGSSWSRMAAPGSRYCDLEGVWASGPNDIFAAGGTGPRDNGPWILHYDGSRWSRMKTPTSLGCATELNGIWGRGPDDVFAVGNSGLILHYNGSSWSRMTNPECAHVRL